MGEVDRCSLEESGCFTHDAKRNELRSQSFSPRLESGKTHLNRLL